MRRSWNTGRPPAMRRSRGPYRSQVTCRSRASRPLRRCVDPTSPGDHGLCIVPGYLSIAGHASVPRHLPVATDMLVRCESPIAGELPITGESPSRATLRSRSTRRSRATRRCRPPVDRRPQVNCRQVLGRALRVRSRPVHRLQAPAGRPRGRGDRALAIARVGITVRRPTASPVTDAGGRRRALHRTKASKDRSAASATRPSRSRRPGASLPSTARRDVRGIARPSPDRRRIVRRPPTRATLAGRPKRNRQPVLQEAAADAVTMRGRPYSARHSVRTCELAVPIRSVSTMPPDSVAPLVVRG